MLTYFISLIAGMLLPLAFAPFNLYTLGFIAPAILFYIWLDAKPLKAFTHGLLFGIGFFGVGISWVYISIHNFGNTSLLQASFITFLLIFYLALYPALQGLIVTRLWKNRSNTIKCLCILPVSWIIFEWLRTHIFTGFPWLLLGYSATTTPLKGLAPLIGIYGLSLAVALICGSLTLLARQATNSIKTICILIIGLSVALGWLINGHSYTKPTAKPIQVSLVQGNIPIKLKWDNSYIQNILKTYTQLTKQHLSSQLIIWPENSVPAPPQQIAKFYDKLALLAKNNNTTILFGAPTYVLNSKTIYNSLIVVGPEKIQYNKRHLVPFGEFIPAKSIFGVIFNTLQIPMSNFTPGSIDQPNLRVDGINMAPFICYEIAFPGEVLRHMHNKQLIVVISDDAWFGHSRALAQHLQMAVMRAMETQRYVLFSANTGITAVISPQGKVTQIEPFKQGVLTQTIQPTQGETPLMRFGYYPVWLIGLLLLVLAYFRKKK